MNQPSRATAPATSWRPRIPAIRSEAVVREEINNTPAPTPTRAGAGAGSFGETRPINFAIRGVCSTLAITMILAGTQTAAAERCAARAELAGDASAVVRVTAELARLGVEQGRPAPGC